LFIVIFSFAIIFFCCLSAFSAYQTGFLFTGFYYITPSATKGKESRQQDDQIQCFRHLQQSFVPGIVELSQKQVFVEQFKILLKAFSSMLLNIIVEFC